MLVEKTEDNQVDLGMITHVCPLCDSQYWNVQVVFVDYEIGEYLTPMECANCGARALAPTLLDKPNEPDGSEEEC